MSIVREKLKAELLAVTQTAKRTEVYVHAFQRVAGVKGAEPLVAPAGAKSPVES
jgi:hypothetical protein